MLSQLHTLCGLENEGDCYDGLWRIWTEPILAYFKARLLFTHLRWWSKKDLSHDSRLWTENQTRRFRLRSKNADHSHAIFGT